MTRRSEQCCVVVGGGVMGDTTQGIKTEQRQEVTKQKYLMAALKVFRGSVLYFSIHFCDDFLLLLRTFVRTYLLTIRKICRLLLCLKLCSK